MQQQGKQLERTCAFAGALQYYYAGLQYFNKLQFVLNNVQASVQPNAASDGVKWCQDVAELCGDFTGDHNARLETTILHCNRFSHPPWTLCFILKKSAALKRNFKELYAKLIPMTNAEVNPDTRAFLLQGAPCP
jgi:hypothetical protein